MAQHTSYQIMFNDVFCFNDILKRMLCLHVRQKGLRVLSFQTNDLLLLHHLPNTRLQSYPVLLYATPTFSLGNKYACVIKILDGLYAESKDSVMSLISSRIHLGSCSQMLRWALVTMGGSSSLWLHPPVPAVGDLIIAYCLQDCHLIIKTLLSGLYICFHIWTSSIDKMCLVELPPFLCYLPLVCYCLFSAFSVISCLMWWSSQIFAYIFFRLAICMAAKFFLFWVIGKGTALKHVKSWTQWTYHVSVILNMILFFSCYVKQYF